MAKLSLCIIARNEAHILGRVLSAASQFCDEMIVVDTGSTDDTVSVAAAAGAKVHHFAWIDDFAAARNYSFAQATGDWFLWLDADDVLSPDTVEIGLRIKNELLDKTDVDAIFAPYNYAYNEDDTVAIKQSRERFVRRSSNPIWVGRVHEVIQNSTMAFITCPEFVVEHRPPASNMTRKKSRNISIFDQFVDTATCTDCRTLYQYGGELRAAERFEEAARVYERYLEVWPADQHDLFQEPYMVRIDLCETYRKLNRARAALKTAADAVAYDGSRAEGYALLALTHYEMDNIAAAFPTFLAAAACKAPTHGGLVYQAFYSASVHDMIKECKARLAGA